MKNKYIYWCWSILALFVVFLNACEKNELVHIEGVESWVMKEECFELPMSELVIQDSSALAEQLIAHRKNINGCRAYMPPFVDFGQHTLLGLKTEVEACTVSFVRAIFADTQNNKYHYQVTATSTQNSDCNDSLLVNMNWVVVPKLPANFEVNFEVSYLTSP